jgi:hypothetical protein
MTLSTHNSAPITISNLTKIVINQKKKQIDVEDKGALITQASLRFNG